MNVSFRLSIFLLALTGAASAQVVGVGNFGRVSELLYRGAQPTPAGLEGLKKLGVKVIIDLRTGEDRAGERQLAEKLGLRYIHEPMSGFSAPSTESIERVMSAIDVAAAEHSPVFVHCMRGKDRTGVVIAAYRIRQEGWSNTKALSEARSYGMSRMERAMQAYILRYQPAKPEKKIASAP